MKKSVLAIALLFSSVLSFSLNAPNLSSPSNGATNQNVNVTLLISTVSGASHYDYLLDTLSTFDSPALREFSHSSSSSGWTPNDLYYGKTHYWKARARNATETSEWTSIWSFTTRILGAIQSSPPNGSIDRSVTLTLSITKYGSRDYDYQLDTLPTFDSEALQELTHNNSYSGQSVNNLMYGQKYYWRVRGRNDNDTSGWSDVWDFTTSLLGAWQSSPSNGATGRPVNLSLSVNKLSGNEHIDYQLDTSLNFNSPLLLELTHSNSLSSISVTNLRYGQTYYWRVRGRHSQDISQWSSVWSFTTQYELTTPPTLSLPSNASTDISYANINLIWNSIANANSYQYQVSKDVSFTQVVKSGNTSLTFTNITNLLPATEYYWRVRGENENGYSPWSEVWSFTTQSVILTPPQLVSPTNESVIASSSVDFSWGSVFGASGYSLQVSLDNTFSEGTSTFNTSSTNFYVTGFPFNITLYWRVRATDAFNEGEWSEVWSFSTVEPTLNPPTLILPENQSNGIDFNETTFEWSNVEGATLYTIEITDSDFGPNAFTTNVATNSYTVSWLICETTYHWRVKASDGSLISDWSEVWSFTTAECEVLLNAPLLVLPANESAGIDATEVTFEWNDVSGAKIGRASCRERV